MGLFDQPVSPSERINAAQVCPHCFGQVLSTFGADLRVRGRCASCGHRLHLLKGKVLSSKEAAPYFVVLLAVLAGLAWFAVA